MTPREPLTHAGLVADVAVVYRPDGGFGSGRLIAPGLVLTAAHVVADEKGGTADGGTWNVLLMRMLRPDGTWERPWKAEVAWTGQDGLDIALLAIAADGPDESVPKPGVEPVFASYDGLASLSEVRATGFPTAWRSAGRTRDFTVPGTLWSTTRDGPYGWNAMASPDDPEGWKGMSGSTLYVPTGDGRICLLGILQQVPANFTRGLLDAARMARPFADDAFRALVERALGRPVPVETMRGGALAPERAPTRRVSLLSRFPGLSDGVSGNARASLEGFLADYLLRPSAPLTFLGRQPQLDALDRWLAAPDAPAYAALLGPAGRGKSALAVQWAARVAGRHDRDVVLVPISMRFGLDRADDLGKLFLQRLRHVDRGAAEVTGTPESWLDEIQETLDRDRSAGERPLLVVIDGWDEARDAHWLRLPARPGQGVRLVVCSRLLAGESEAADAFDRIGLPHDTLRPALPLLSADDLARGCAGFEARAPGVARRLWNLSKGDPLLARLYLDLFSEALDRGEAVPDDDPDAEPGLARYMRLWWKQVERAPGALKSEDVRRLLHTLALAFGPLGTDDLAEIAGLDPLDVLDARAPLSRLVIGDGRNLGYVFSHPRIAQFVAEEQMTASARAATEQRFLTVCRRNASALARTDTPTAAPSRYVLTFCIDHFSRGQAPIDDYRLLLSEGWMRAWWAADRHYSGFAAEVLRLEAITAGFDAVDLATRCALAKASVTSMSTALPAELLRMALDEGVISGRQAVEEVRASENDRARAISLAILAGGLLAEDVARALELAWQVRDPEARRIALAALSGVLSAAERDALAQALDATPRPRDAVGVLLQRAIDARLGRAVAPDLPAQWTATFDDESRARIWDDVPKYIEWARHVASVLDGADRDAFVRAVVHSTRLRRYKWLEYGHSEELVRAIGAVAPADALDFLDDLLVAAKARGEGPRHLLARRVALQLCPPPARVEDGLDEARPWESLPMLAWMGRPQQAAWAERCVASFEDVSVHRRWHDLSRCLPFVAAGRRASFVKETWAWARQIQDLDQLMEFGAAAAAALPGAHKASHADRFLARIDGVRYSNANTIARLGREASPHGRRFARERIAALGDSRHLAALLLLCPGLEPDERARMIDDALQVEQIGDEALRALAGCFDVLAPQERRDLAAACLDRFAGHGKAWSHDRGAGLACAEMIEALAGPIASTLGTDAVSRMARVASRITDGENRALAHASLAGCTAGGPALEFATQALLDFVADDHDDRAPLLHRVGDLRPIAAVVPSASILTGLPEALATRVARVVEAIHELDDPTGRREVEGALAAGDVDALVAGLKHASDESVTDLRRFFAILAQAAPVRSPVTRELWLRGMESAATRGRPALLRFLMLSVPLAATAFDADEFKGIADAVLDVTSWAWQ